MIGHELMHLVTTGISLVGLGIVMGFSPTLIAVSLRVLSQAPRAARAMGYMLFGLTLGSALLLLLLQVIDPRSVEAVLRHDVEAVLVRRWVDLLAGGVFLAAGIVMVMRARRPPRPEKPRKPMAGKPWEMTLIGLSNSVMGVSGLATMYLVARILRAAGDTASLHDLSWLAYLLAYAVFVAAMVGPYVLLTWVWMRFPAVSQRIKELFARLAEVDVRPWAAALTLLVGAVVLAMGIWGEPRL